LIQGARGCGRAGVRARGVRGRRGCRGAGVRGYIGEGVRGCGTKGMMDYRGKVVWGCTKEDKCTAAMHSMYHGRAASGCMVRWSHAHMAR